MNSLVSKKHLYLITLLILSICGGIEAQDTTPDQQVTKHFLILLTSDNDQLVDQSLEFIRHHWKKGYEIMLLETLHFSMQRKVSQSYLELLQSKTGKNFGRNLDDWYHWLWNQPADYLPEYFDFKARLYGLIDSKFAVYFSKREKRSTIRLDEVMWGGVLQDGIPPLRNPKMLPAEHAVYMSDEDIVFGIELNGDARAYPKRILAWHEMFTDEVGGLSLAGVYCTLCGTVIVYNTDFTGHSYKLGTSGFLYRSNKLMYDMKTQSLWSTLGGEPVIGPLVGRGIKLPYIGVVTTTWGEWKKRHPRSTVLSLDTGFKRDYSEGVAYASYFATDELMFQVPVKDDRLKNKDEILAIRLPQQTDDVMAISSAFLKKTPLYRTELGGVTITVFTDKSGAHRAYATQDHHFTDYEQTSVFSDSQGNQWKLEEAHLISDHGIKLKRIPTYNAFWFGFRAAFPDTFLVY